MVPPSTAARPYPGRTPHWIKGNAQERIPHRWIVADSESHRTPTANGEVQTHRLTCAQRWRDDLATGDHTEHLRTKDAREFWEWVRDHCHTHGRTTLAFHNASHDLAILDAFTILPQLGFELAWANLDRDVSVASWRGPHGSLLIWDTFTWWPTSLEVIAGAVGGTKPPLPGEDAPDSDWRARCEADVDATRRFVEEILSFVRTQHLGNWQPSGAGMGHTTWRHRFMTHKVLIHDDSGALDAERAAMHTGRAEAWWHGKARNGPFTEWDMHMSYARIAAECLLPAKLREHDTAPSRKVHDWALEHFRTLARVTVSTDIPVLPAHINGRIVWPVGEFTDCYWDTELQLLREAGIKYQVHEQWRYSRKPVLKEWAEWSMAMCEPGAQGITTAQRAWVKHQSRAVIGRMALRSCTWEPYCENWMNGYTGLSLLTEEGRADRRLMHVGSQVWEETERTEADNSCPQITSWIMAEARSRLWRATLTAGQGHVLHVDTDSLIADRTGSLALAAAVTDGLPGGWRPKATWRRLAITGPRHYAAPGREQVPGVPRRAVKRPDGTFEGEVWDSLAHTLSEGRSGQRIIRTRTWTPTHTDHRRPYTGETDGPAQPQRVTLHTEENTHVPIDQRQAAAV
jgi:hypothetical protein